MEDNPTTAAVSSSPPSASRGWAGQLWVVLSRQRLRPVWYVALAGCVAFTGFRAALLLVSFKELATVSSADIGKCFLIGLWYDAMPLGYALLPMLIVLLLAPAGAFEKRWFRRIFTGYCAAATVIFLGVEIAGAAFFLEFGTRLNWLAVDHLGHFVESALYIWTQYPVWLLVLGGGLASFVFARIYSRVLWRRRRGGGVTWARMVCLLVLGALAVLGCRGSFRRPLLYGPSYFCDNKALAQLTLNNIFTLTHALRAMINDNRDEERFYQFPKLDRAKQVTAKLLFQEADRPLGSADNPLWRLTNTRHPIRDHNVVLIIMEGMAGPPVGALGHSPSYTPRLDRLCQEGLLFERMYAVGTRTNRGVMGTLCGHPDLGALSVIKRRDSQGNWLTLPGIFKSRGYHTLFIYGGDPEFDNMKGFFQADGIETFVCQDDMGPSILKENWGYHDEVVLGRAHETFLAQGSKRFFAVVLTISNHRPYVVPAGRVKLLNPTNDHNKRLNGYRYADWALGDFFDRASKAPYFRNTIFVLVADHAQVFDRKQLVDVVSFRVPCLFYAPGIPGFIPPGSVSVVGSQTDIAPTLLAMLGGSYRHCFMGRNLLEVAPGDGFALLHDDDRLAVVRADHALVRPSDLKRPPRLFKIDSLKMESIPYDKADLQLLRRLQLQMLSYYKMAKHLYMTGPYQEPAKVAPLPPKQG